MPAILAYSLLAGSIMPKLHQSDWSSPPWRLRDEYLNLEKYRTNRSPKRLQSLLASMAHFECSSPKQDKSWKAVQPEPLSTEYKRARIAQLDAKENQITGLTVEEMSERDKLFISLPRRVRRQLNHRKANRCQ